MVAGSTDIGGTTTTGLLQAVDGGIKLVVVSGGAYTTKGSTTGAILARPDAGITKPADFAGKTVGVPGIGAILHVLTENWLVTNGVDPKKVTYVELSFLQMKDSLGRGIVDAVVTAEPTFSQILQAGVGGGAAGSIARSTRRPPASSTRQPRIGHRHTRIWCADSTPPTPRPRLTTPRIPTRRGRPWRNTCI